MKKQYFIKLTSAVIVASICMTIALAGCGSKKVATVEQRPTEKQESTTKKPVEEKPVTLNYLVFSTEAYDAYQKMDLVGNFKKTAPNITVEIEKVKDSGEFENVLKIRKAANELPDIMPMKPYMLSKFKDDLAPLNDLDVAKNNLFAEKFAIDGSILGMPECMFNEYVWYKKSIFKEYNIEIPKTWDELIQVCETIKNDGKYIPILMGGKDAWPDYPFNEFMPSLEANDGYLWNHMAEQDEPFSKNQPFYKAYVKIKKLYDSKPFGSDPLGAGFDQVKTMFGTKGAMIAAGAWFLNDAKKAVADTDDIGTFFLPVKDNADDKLNTVTMVDGFFATPKDGKNIDAAKTFISYLFSEEFYAPYMKDRGLVSTLKNIKVELDPILQQAYDNTPDVNYVVYDGGNEEFQKIAAAVKFDVKKMGQEMMAGKDLDEMMAELNKAWKEARSRK